MPQPEHHPLPPGPRKALLTWGGTLLRLGIAAGTFLYAIHDVQWQELGAALLRSSPWYLLLALAYSLVMRLIPARRLAYLASGGLGLGAGYNAVLLGFGLNNILPAKLGEIAKAAYLGRRVEGGMAQSLSMVFWERLSDIAAVLVVLVAAFAVDDRGFPVLPLVLTVAALAALPLVLRSLRGLVQRILVRLPSGRLTNQAASFLDLICRPLSARFLLHTGLLTAATWVAYFGGMVILVRLVADIPLDMPGLLILFAASCASYAVPSTPGALGVYEAAWVLALGWFGIPREQALAAALAQHAIQFLPTTLYAVALLSPANLRALRRTNRPNSGLPPDRAG